MGVEFVKKFVTNRIYGVRFSFLSTSLTGFLGVHVDHPFYPGGLFLLVQVQADLCEPVVQVFTVVADQYQLGPVAVGAAGDQGRELSLIHI